MFESEYLRLQKLPNRDIYHSVFLKSANSSFLDAGEMIANGGFFKDDNCNQCVCRDGEISCEVGNSCMKGCFFNNMSLRDGGLFIGRSIDSR